MNTQKINIAIIDDHKLIRQALINYVKSYESAFQINIVLEGDDGDFLLDNIGRHPVEIAIVDLYMVRFDGIYTIKKLRNINPDQKILVVSMSTDLAMISDLLDLGIQCYISKSDDLKMVPEAIIALHQDKPFQTKIMTDALYFARTHKEQKNKHTRKVFSNRELMIIDMLWEEKNNKEIADSLFLGVRSVEKIIHEMKAKVNAVSLTGLFKYCIGNKIIRQPNDAVSK